MAKQLKLSAQVRSGVGRSAVRKLKTAGFIPANIYGAGEGPANLQLQERAVKDLLSHSAGENLLVDIEITDGDQKSSRLALIQEIQHHPVSQAILHVDLQAVKSDEKITTEVPVESTGEPVGVKTYGGLLEQLLRHVEIECLPRDLPEVIYVDVTHLNLSESVHVSDLKLPAGVEAVTDAEIALFIVTEPRVSDDTAAEGAAAAPEVIKEKKTEGDAKK